MRVYKQLPIGCSLRGCLTSPTHNQSPTRPLLPPTPHSLVYPLTQHRYPFSVRGRKLGRSWLEATWCSEFDVVGLDDLRPFHIVYGLEVRIRQSRIR